MLCILDMFSEHKTSKKCSLNTVTSKARHPLIIKFSLLLLIYLFCNRDPGRRIVWGTNEKRTYRIKAPKCPSWVSG